VFPLMFIVSRKHLPTLFIVHSQDIHKDEIFKKSRNIISLTPKCPFLQSLRTHIMKKISFLASQKSGKIFKTIRF
jgi:hypothetical protein